MNFYIGNAAVVVPAIWSGQRRGRRRGHPGAVPRPHCNWAACRPHPDGRRKLPLYLATGSTMTKLTVAALQLAFTEDTTANIRAVSELVREAAGRGAPGRASARAVRRALFLPGRGREPLCDRKAGGKITLRCSQCRHLQTSFRSGSRRASSKRRDRITTTRSQ